MAGFTYSLNNLCHPSPAITCRPQLLKHDPRWSACTLVTVATKLRDSLFFCFHSASLMFNQHNSGFIQPISSNEVPQKTISEIKINQYCQLQTITFTFNLQIPMTKSQSIFSMKSLNQAIQIHKCAPALIMESDTKSEHWQQVAMYLVAALSIFLPQKAAAKQAASMVALTNECCSAGR